MSRRHPPTTLATAGVAALAALFVLFVSADLFPYHSVNHDEGVYLQQARLLLDGQFSMSPPVPEAFRWWFFVDDGGRLYPKYAPVPAAVFALGTALGEPRASLALVTFGNVLLVGLVTAEAFDRRTGIVAAALLATTPLFVIQSATFLPYAVTTLFNLLFALGYVRSVRRHSYGYAALAGVALGVAFFARPFTAVLFATPFVFHAVYALLATSLEDDLPALGRQLLRNGVITVLGLAGVGATLYYNAVVTGDPFTFPYEAFAPRDGLGFGEREILAYSREYTPELALRANRLVVESFLTRWSFAAPLGAVLALFGLLVSVGPGAEFVGSRARARQMNRVYNAYDEALRVTLAGVAVTVIAGNVLFWGNLNVLADLADPTDGLIASLGPFYHFDLLVPFSTFAAAGLVFGWRVLREAGVEAGLSERDTRIALSVVLVAALAVGGFATANAVSDPLDRNQAYTDRYEVTYEPFESRTGGDWSAAPFGSEPAFEDALVFLPTPYGEWLGHPFQSLSNDGDLDGTVVYALDGSAARDFRVIDAHEGRTLYRYTYRGVWSPDPDTEVTAAVEGLDVRTGAGHDVATTVGVVGRPSTVRLEAGDETASYDVEGDLEGTLTVPWTIEDGEARVTGSAFGSRSDGTVRFSGTETLSLSVTFLQPGGSTLTYRQEVAVEVSDGAVRVLWPPETRVCRLTPDCGTTGTYLPGQGEYVDGVSVDTSIESSA